MQCFVAVVVIAILIILILLILIFAGMLHPSSFLSILGSLCGLTVELLNYVS